MALVTPPETLPIKRIQWQLRTANQVNRSGWTGRRQVSTSQPNGAVFACSAEFKPQRTQATARKWRGFFASLNGTVNHFPVIAVESVQHTGAETTIASGSAGANTLELAGGTPSLQYGDMMTVKLSDGTYQLVCLTAPISGVTVTFMPPLRASAATGAGSVETVLPFAHVALDDAVVEWAVEPGQIYGFSFTATEAF